MKKNLYILIYTLLLSSLFSCEKIIMQEDISNSEVTLLAPLDNAQFYNTSVNFYWENLKDAQNYQLQIASPNFNAPSQIVLDTILTKTSYSRQLNKGVYEWRLRAISNNYNTSYKTRVINIVNNDDFQNNTIILTSPSNNLNTNTTSQNLSWQAIVGATSYQIQIVDTGTNVIVSDQNTTNTNINFNFSQGNYQWRVRASNGANQTLYNARTIIVDTTVPNTPNLTSPSNISTSSNTKISFEWTRIPIAGSTEKDSIYVYTNANLTNLQFKNQGTSPFPNTLNVGNYYWFVKSFDAAGNVSNKSNTFNFTIN